MKRVMRTTSDCILIAILCFSVLIVGVAPVAFADVGDLILTRVTSENEDEYVQAVGTQIASSVNPAYGYLFSTIDDCLELKDMSQSIIYDPATDEGGKALVDENSDVGYALAEDGTLIRIDNFSGRGGGGGRSRVDSADDVKISAATFSEICQMYEDHYGPKNVADYISWRTDKRYSTHSGTKGYLSFFSEGTFPHGKIDDIYMVGFYKNADGVFCSQVQLHFYQQLTYDSSGAPVISLYVEYWDMIEKTDPIVELVTNQLATYRYLDFTFYSDSISFGGYQKYSDYITIADPWTLRSSFYGSRYYWNADCSVCTDFPYGNPANGTFEIGCTYNKTVAAHDDSCSHGCDYGYYISPEPIEMNFDGVDWSQFTAEDTVTLSGDTIYDYIITNNTTGDSTTVNNYITNNYNYPVTDSGDSGEDEGGSASGNVNVSGNIDVGGSVDVNVNVNTNGSADGGSMPVDVDLNNYLEQTPEQAKPITEFFSIFFDFLPPELLGLICLGVAVAIILRIWGR